VGSAPADHGAEGDEGVEPAGAAEVAEGERELPGPRGADDDDVSGAGPAEGVEGSVEKPRDDDVVRPGGHDAEAAAG
jgi:hypothetical protein